MLWFVVPLLSKNRGIVAISVVAASVIVRNCTIEARFPGGMKSFVSSCPNQTFCTDGTISRVAFMAVEDARRFMNQLVAAGLAASVEEAHSEIALVTQGQGFMSVCNWLQLGLFDGRSCAWLAGADRGNLCIPEFELNSKIDTFNAGEFHETFELVSLRGNGKIEVYRHKKTGKKFYRGRPFRPPRKWWQFWKKPEQQPVGDASNQDEIYRAACDLVLPYVEHQLTQAPLDKAAQEQLRHACEMLERVLELDPRNWAALWCLGIARKCVRELEPAYFAFERAYAIEKDNPDVGRELSGICMALGKGEEAVRISRELVDRNPQNAGLISNHALALLIAGNIHEAEIAVESARRLEPEDQITRSLAKGIAAVRTNQAPRPDRYPPAS